MSGFVDLQAEQKPDVQGRHRRDEEGTGGYSVVQQFLMRTPLQTVSCCGRGLLFFRRDWQVELCIGAMELHGEVTHGWFNGRGGRGKEPQVESPGVLPATTTGSRASTGQG